MYPTRIIVADATDSDDESPFCQATNFTVTPATFVINAVPAGNSWATAVVLPALGQTMNFTFTFSGIGARAQGTRIYWTIFEDDLGFDDCLWNEIPITVAGAGNNGAFTETVTFALWTSPQGHVTGGTESSDEARPDIIKAQLEWGGGTDIGISTNGIFVRV